MAYGFEVTNTSGQLVINDTQALYVLKSSGVLSNSGTTNTGAYKFTPSGASIPTGNDIILWQCGVGNFISFNLGGTDANVGFMCSDQSTLNYSVYGPRTDLSNPTGYGVAVYNAAGQCTWDSASTVTPISNGGIIGGASLLSKTYVSSAIAGENAVQCSGGSLYIDLDDGIYAMAAERLASTVWRFKQQKIHDLTGSGIPGNATFECDFSYILGTT